MKRIFLGFTLFFFFVSASGKIHSATLDDQLKAAYQYAYELYVDGHFPQAKEIFKKIIIASANPGLNANSLYYYSQCAIRIGDYDNCITALAILTKKWRSSAAIQKGYVKKFALAVIPQVAQIQTHWDYYRYEDGLDDKGQWIFKESVPPSHKIKRINFRLGFGLYRILQQIQPNSPETLGAKQMLEKMLNMPMTISWIDEKPGLVNRGVHPPDFVSFLKLSEKKEFSKVICERMFYNWQTDKLYELMDMSDDIRNLKSLYSATTREPTPLENATASVPNLALPPGALPPPPPGANDAQKQLSSEEIVPPFTLANLFKVAGYDPYTDNFANVIESSNSNLNM